MTLFTVLVNFIIKNQNQNKVDGTKHGTQCLHESSQCKLNNNILIAESWRS